MRGPLWACSGSDGPGFCHPTPWGRGVTGVQRHLPAVPGTFTSDRESFQARVDREGVPAAAQARPHASAAVPRVTPRPAHLPAGPRPGAPARAAALAGSRLLITGEGQALPGWPRAWSASPWTRPRTPGATAGQNPGVSWTG